jgi:hypothetical protein
MWLSPATTASTAYRSMTPFCAGPSSDMAPEPRYVPPDAMLQVPGAVRQIFIRVSLRAGCFAKAATTFYSESKNWLTSHVELGQQPLASGSRSNTV